MTAAKLILPPRRIAFLATPNAQALEVAGPVEVFAMADRKLKEAGRARSPAYTIDILSTSNDLTITSASGLCLTAQRCYREVTEPLDTLLVAGGLDLWSAKNDPGFTFMVTKAGEAGAQDRVGMHGGLSAGGSRHSGRTAGHDALVLLPAVTETVSEADR